MRVPQPGRVVPVGAGVAHGRVEHGLEHVVANVVVLLAHLEGASAGLKIEQAMAQDFAQQTQLRPVVDFFLDLGAQKTVEKLVQPLAFPHPVHIGLTEAKRTFRQDKLVDAFVEYPYIPGRVAVDRDAGIAGKLANDSGGRRVRRSIPGRVKDEHVFRLHRGFPF